MPFKICTFCKNTQCSYCSPLYIDWKINIQHITNLLISNTVRWLASQYPPFGIGVCYWRVMSNIVCIVGFAPRGKVLYVAILKTYINKYRSVIYSIIVPFCIGPTKWLKRAGYHTAKSIFRIGCVTNGYWPCFFRINSRFHGYSNRCRQSLFTRY